MCSCNDVIKTYHEYSNDRQYSSNHLTGLGEIEKATAQPYVEDDVRTTNPGNFYKQCQMYFSIGIRS